MSRMYVCYIVCAWGLISVESGTVPECPNNSLVGVVYCAYFVSLTCTPAGQDAYCFFTSVSSCNRMNITVG